MKVLHWLSSGEHGRWQWWGAVPEWTFTSWTRNRWRGEWKGCTVLFKGINWPPTPMTLGLSFKILLPKVSSPPIVPPWEPSLSRRGPHSQSHHGIDSSCFGAGQICVFLIITFLFLNSEPRLSKDLFILKLLVKVLYLFLSSGDCWNLWEIIIKFSASVCTTNEKIFVIKRFELLLP